MNDLSQFQPRREAQSQRWFSSGLVLAVLLILSAVISGCASVPMAAMADDAKAKTFAVPPGKSSIYVYRNESFGGAVPMSVVLDGKHAGQSAAMTYFLFEADPGPHELSSVAENTVTLKLNTVEGKAYFVWQEVKMGVWMARTQLSEVDEATGRKAVAECKRVQSSF